MSRFHYFILIFLFVIPLFGYSSSEKNQEFEIKKQKLKCLYEEIDDLLDEDSDSVWVLLKDQCVTSSTNGERAPGPGRRIDPSPRIDKKNPSLSSAEDILLLSKNQLRCFKKNYPQFMEQDKDPASVRFVNECGI